MAYFNIGNGKKIKDIFWTSVTVSKPENQFQTMASEISQLNPAQLNNIQIVSKMATMA